MIERQDVEMTDDTIYKKVMDMGVSNQNFVRACNIIAGSMGAIIPSLKILDESDYFKQELLLICKIEEALKSKSRISVIWLDFSKCKNYCQSLINSNNLLFDSIGIENLICNTHELPSGQQEFDQVKKREKFIDKYAGKYILIVIGGIPISGGDYYINTDGKATSRLYDELHGASFIIAAGNCAAFGCTDNSHANVTRVRSVVDLIGDVKKPVVNVPGCPALSEVYIGTLLYYLVFNSIPELDNLHRPMPFYGITNGERYVSEPACNTGIFTTCIKSRYQKEIQEKNM